MTTFINIHTLISHPSSMMNRDDSGLQKTAVFGGTVRSRISSQCLKRAIRKSELYDDLIKDKSIRTRNYSELVNYLTKNTEFDKELVESVIKALSIKTGSLESSIVLEDEEVEVESEDGKKEKIKTGEKIASFKTIQSYSTAEFEAFVSTAQEMVPGVFEEVIKGLPPKAKKSEKERFRKIIPEFQNISKVVKSVCDVALSGRMDTHCSDRNIEAAMSVAHSISTHSADIEVDWFTACDDLAKQGSGHISTTEFSAGVFYRYASINLDLLAKNIQMQVSELSPIINTMVKCFALVTPPAKQKVFAAHNIAEFLLITKADLPLSLANAFRKPIENGGDVMESSISALINHYEKLKDAYDMQSDAIGMDLTGIAAGKTIRWVNNISDIQF